MSDDFRFFPRPEAHAMAWDHLFSPVQRAVKDLLLRIEGVTRDEAKEGGVAASCFLVYGDRGTGKTTVLLSAQRACSREGEDFFPKEDEENKKDPVLADARARASRLRNVVWLEVLDLEPLPPRPNLLTTVLTRVRKALDVPGHEKKTRELTSILEESADSARHKLDQLINDATLMWEDILEPDTRSRANRQVAAADIYAEFRDRFEDAMDTLSLELGRRSGSLDTHRSIILPVDNIDRSTDHLYHIIKLAQMVSCPRLWLVMAGDRQDVDTFLERAFWKELIRVGEGAGATGKVGLGGEDEALVMARRQAAAASHKLLPPNHRVEVQLVEPEETLKFSGAPDKNEDEIIRNMLQDIVLEDGAIGNNDAEKEKKEAKIRLIDLFDVTSRVEQVVGETRKRYLTDAAELGLRLSARGVLDLWQITRGRDKGLDGALQAEQIVRTMLRNAISESMMSSEMGRLLRDRIVRRTPTGATVLDFYDPALDPPSRLEVLRVMPPELEISLGQQAREYWPPPEHKDRPEDENRPDKLRYKQFLIVDSTLSALYSKARFLKLRPSPQPAEASGTLTGGEQDIALYVKYLPTSEGTETGDILPDLVGAWVISLYDAVVLGNATESTALGPTPMKAPVIVERKHATSEGREYASEWPMPSWGSFIAYDLNGKLWRHFLSALARERGGNKLKDQPARQGYLTRLLTVGWVACALETFFSFPPRTREGWQRPGEVFEALRPSILGYDLCLGRFESVDKLPRKKKSTVVVAYVGADLYIRFFYEKNEFVDKPQSDLNASDVAYIKDRLQRLRSDAKSLSEDEKQKAEQEIIERAASVTQSPGEVFEELRPSILRYDLCLGSFKSVDELPEKKKSTVVVAYVGADLYIRFFYEKNEFVDKPQRDLIGSDVGYIKDRLQRLLSDTKSLTEDEKRKAEQEIIERAASVTGCSCLDDDLYNQEEVKKTIEEGEQKVLEAAAKLYETIVGKDRGKESVSLPEDKTDYMQAWLEHDLPFLLTDWDVERPSGTTTMAGNIIPYLGEHKGETLLKAWRRNSLYLRLARENATRILFPKPMLTSTPIGLGDPDPFQHEKADLLYGGLEDWFAGLFPEFWDKSSDQGSTGKNGQE